jgi:hypothetical protein
MNIDGKRKKELKITHKMKKKSKKISLGIQKKELINHK